MKCLVITTILLFAGFANIQCARILGVIPTPAYSHQSVFQPIWRALAERGHDLVVVTANPMNDPSLPNLKEIDISFSYLIKDQRLTAIIKDKQVGFAMFHSFADYFEALLTTQFEDPGVQDLIHNKSLHFDLVMFEYLAPVYGAFAHKFNCPSVGLMSYEISPDLNDILGNPQHPAVSPLVFLPLFRNLNLYERLQNSVLYILWPIINKIMFESLYDEIIKTYFGAEYPASHSYLKNVDMVFSNINPVFKIPTPVGPNVILFGGVHINKPKPLPIDIGEFLSLSEKGVVYFSLGSNIKSEFVNDKLRNVLLESLTSLPYDVLWKFEEEIVTDNPKIKIVKWAPQQDILTHPNVKVFITQCGLQSLEEALYGHVPVIGLPFFGDQHRNAKMIEYLGIGKTFNYDELRVDKFKKAIIEVASNPKYKAKMVELVRISKDQPISAIDSVVWWTEYVIRNNGAKHLRSALVDLPWYQYYMLDVYGCIVLVVFIIPYIMFNLFKLVCFIRNNPIYSCCCCFVYLDWLISFFQKKDKTN